MLLAFLVLSGAAAGGLTLLGLRGRHWRPLGLNVPILHGAAGATGFVLLILALRHAATTGIAATDAVWLIAGGLALGLYIAWRGWQGRDPGSVVFVHAALAGLGYLLLAGFVLG